MEENKIPEKFLPIGTVVVLKGGKKELMIISYCIIPTGEAYDASGKVDVQNKMYDYGACTYPEGMITSDQLFAFNQENIEKVVFTGYQTDAQKEISKFLLAGIEERNRRVEAYQAEQAANNETQA